MDAKQFLADFEHIANAPDGVSKLREMILRLAVSGKLPIKKSSDNGQSFLEEISKNRNAKISRKEIKSNKKIKPTPDAFPFEIPDHWSWARFGDLACFSPGRTPPRKELIYWNTGEYPWFSIADMKHQKVISKSSETISEEAREKIFKSDPVKAGTLIMSFKLTIGRLSILGNDSYHNEAIISIYPFSEELKDYFFKCLNGFDLTAGNKAAIKGSTLNQDSISNLLVTIPPKDEIPRIVAKVDELMTLCDKLEVQQKQKRKLQNHLRQSTFQALAEAGKPEEFQEGWKRLAGSFSQLFAEAEDVVSFKGLILDLAVSGHLLNFTTPHEKTGRFLLEEINEERLKWATESEDQELKEAQTMIRKIKKQKLIYPDSPLPQNWVWGSFLEISQAVIDCHNKTAPYVSNGIHLIRTSDIRDGKMDLHNTKKITEETYDYWSRRMPPRAGDVFFTREAPMGEVALVPEGDKVCLGQRTMLLRLFPNLFNNQFLVYVIQSPSFQKRMMEAGVGMTVKHLRVGGVEDLAVPVPPKDEQDKIVTLIGKLFEICDGFAKQLKLERQISANLAATSVATLTGITNTQQEAPMKAPKTELKAPVRLGKNQPSNTTKAPLASLLSRHNGEMSANDLWQRFGGEIDAFYAQLKTEVSQGWIAEPTDAQMLEREVD